VNIKETEKTGVTEQVYLFLVALLLLLFRQKKKNGITNGVAKGRGRAIFKDLERESGWCLLLSTILTKLQKQLFPFFF
jgi:hypothetical protein